MQAFKKYQKKINRWKKYKKILHMKMLKSKTIPR